MEEVTRVAPVEILPVGENSHEIYKLKRHALIGISPFNSYFTEPNLVNLFSWSLTVFEKISVFIPDKLSMFTLMALGYTQKEAEHKTRKQDSYLQNKVIRALKVVGFDESKARELIVTLTHLSNNQRYQTIYNDCLIKFEKQADFRNNCLLTSSWILENNPKSGCLGEKELMTAVQYFLREFPLFLDTPAILNIESSLFIYHQVPTYLESLYVNKEIISPKQGFLKVRFNTLNKDSYNYLER